MPNHPWILRFIGIYFFPFLDFAGFFQLQTLLPGDLSAAPGCMGADGQKNDQAFPQMYLGASPKQMGAQSFLVTFLSGPFVMTQFWSKKDVGSFRRSVSEPVSPKSNSHWKRILINMPFWGPCREAWWWLAKLRYAKPFWGSWTTFTLRSHDVFVVCQGPAKCFEEQKISQTQIIQINFKL